MGRRTGSGCWGCWRTPRTGGWWWWWWSCPGTVSEGWLTLTWRCWDSLWTVSQSPSWRQFGNIWKSRKYLRSDENISMSLRCEIWLRTEPPTNHQRGAAATTAESLSVRLLAGYWSAIPRTGLWLMSFICCSLLETMSFLMLKVKSFIS